MPTLILKRDMFARTWWAYKPAGTEKDLVHQIDSPPEQTHEQAMADLETQWVS